MRSLALALVLLVLPRVSFAAEKPTRLVLRLSVNGARVEVDGQLVREQARQEVELRLPAGQHVVVVTHEGFERWERRITAPGPEGETLEVALVPERLEERGGQPKPSTNAPTQPPSASAPAPRPSRKPTRIAVYEVRDENAGLDPRGLRLLTEALLGEVRKLDRVSAIGMNEVSEMLSFEQQRQLLGCGDDSCLAELGGALGVDELVTASVGGLGESRLFTIRRTDLTQATVKGAFNRRLQKADGEELLATVGPAIAELFAEVPLREGRARGVPDAVLARLHPPPLPPLVPYVTGAAAGLGLVTGAIFGLAAHDAETRYRTLVDNAVGTAASGSDARALYDLASSRATEANVAFLVAGVLAVGTVVELFYTRWDEADGAGGGLDVTPTGVRGRF